MPVFVKDYFDKFSISSVYLLINYLTDAVFPLSFIICAVYCALYKLCVGMRISDLSESYI